MPNSEAQAWWADVQHVRETIERRRAGLADSPAPQDAGRETRFSRSAATAVDDLDWTQVSAARAGAYADETGRPLHDGASPRARRPGADGSDHGAARARRDADHPDADGRHESPRATRRQGARSDAVGRDAGSA